MPRSSYMPVDVAQVAEVARRDARSVIVSVIAAEAPAVPEIEAVLDACGDELIVQSTALAELEASASDVYVLYGCPGENPLKDREDLVERVPGPLVVVVPPSATVKGMRAALRTGVAGLVHEADVHASLVATVQAVRGGQLVLPLEVGRQIEKPVLSRRQKQVLGLVVLGLSNGEIALELHLSEHPVKCHLYSGFRKLGVSSRDEAVAKILDPDSGLGTGILAISGSKSEVAAHGHA